MFSCEFCKISKKNFLYRTPLVAASVYPWHDVIKPLSVFLDISCDKAISLCYNSNIKFVFIVETLVEIIHHRKVE